MRFTLSFPAFTKLFPQPNAATHQRVRPRDREHFAPYNDFVLNNGVVVFYESSQNLLRALFVFLPFVSVHFRGIEEVYPAFARSLEGIERVFSRNVVPKPREASPQLMVPTPMGEIGMPREGSSRVLSATFFALDDDAETTRARVIDNRAHFIAFWGNISSH